MRWLKACYHRTVPERLRNPLGRARRELQDRLRRALSPTPLPPRELLLQVQMTPWVREYLRVGGKAAATLRSTLAAAGFPAGRPLRLLDLGCGCARVSRHLLEPAWELHGCDVDRAAVAWASAAFPAVRFAVSPSSPTLPYRQGAFDAVIAVSLFTHFPAPEQRLWAAELGRILRPGGVALITTMGPPALESFPHHATVENRVRLAGDGFLFVTVGPAFNQSAAFHTQQALQSFFAPAFELDALHQQGLDGFQDLAVLRRTMA